MLIYLLFKCCLLYIAKENDKYKWFKQAVWLVKSPHIQKCHLFLFNTTASTHSSFFNYLGVIFLAGSLFPRPLGAL